MMTGTLPGTLERNQGSMWSRCSCEMAIAVGVQISGVSTCELSGYWNHDAWKLPSGENHGSISSVARALSSLSPACPSAVTFMGRVLLDGCPAQRLATGKASGGHRCLARWGRAGYRRERVRTLATGQLRDAPRSREPARRAAA